MSAAAIVGTVIFALAFLGIAALPGLEGAKPYLLPQQFDAWEALFGQTGVSVGRAAGRAPSTPSSRLLRVGDLRPPSASQAPDPCSQPDEADV